MKYIFDNDPSHRLKRIEFLFGEKESFLRKGLEFPSERIDITSIHNRTHERQEIDLIEEEIAHQY